jgi:hypothetical protein
MSSPSEDVRRGRRCWNRSDNSWPRPRYRRMNPYCTASAPSRALTDDGRFTITLCDVKFGLFIGVPSIKSRKARPSVIGSNQLLKPPTGSQDRCPTSDSQAPPFPLCPGSIRNLSITDNRTGKRGKSNYV